ncbi:glycosyltransferase family 50 protein [Crepidotus variabilis]|uniref:GPI mannosyltransferase 1 n=1 Tax=Crepidotus variabilis TaxID=179855 RepID=A0A9P6JTS8_9AGAR|nr:glycosyltransferase family 50 protein [Crepidotus variabilis]
MSSSLLSFRNVVLLSTALRVGLILYSEWHDERSVVKYTDVDYRVFTDAAAFIANPGPGHTNQAKGPLTELLGRFVNLGDPYSRETYRYTPLLALLLAPNGWLHPSFGKYLFAFCDIVNGVLIYQLLKTEILSRTMRWNPTTSKSRAPARPPAEIERFSTLYAAVHLLNPMVFSISTRGSSESVLSLFVLATLYTVLKDQWDLAAVLLGLSTHWKIYPLVYGLGCLGVISGPEHGNGLKRIVNWRTIRFGFISACTFILLGIGCYAIWGYPFLYESYLYHIHRLDHRHNFSPYFYQTYLSYPEYGIPVDTTQTIWIKLLRSPLTSFVPQMGLALGLGLLFGRKKEDLVFTWFVQTAVFVVFNKVCTSQYFLWYLLLLPLLIPRLSMTKGWAVAYGAVWAGTQALWLSEAYKLEFLGQSVFHGLWWRGLVYVVGNCWVIAGLVDVYDKEGQ